MYAVLSSTYAVSGWRVDFHQQLHIKKARDWLAAVCDEIGEVLNLNLYKRGKLNEQWGDQPMSQNYECRNPPARKKRLGEQSTDEKGKKVKRRDQPEELFGCFEIPSGDY